MKPVNDHERGGDRSHEQLIGRAARSNVQNLDAIQLQGDDDDQGIFLEVGVVAAALGLMVTGMVAAPGVAEQRWGGGNRGGWSAGMRTPGMQMAGGNLTVERVIRLAGELELTAEQRGQLESIRVELLEARAHRAVRQMEQLSEVRAGIREPEAMRAEARETAAQARESLDGIRDRYAEILTEEQRRELRQLNRRAGWRDRAARNNRGSARFDLLRDSRGRGAPDRWRGAVDRWRGDSDRWREAVDRWRGDSNRGRGAVDRGRGTPDPGRGQSPRPTEGGEAPRWQGR